MVSRHQTNIPRLRDKVYSEERMQKGLQPNGYVASILWNDDEILVKFHDNVESESSYKLYSLDEFEGTFSDAYGGTWFPEGLGEMDEGSSNP